MEIIRFNVFDKKYRFRPFTVKEYRDLLLVRTELDEDETALNDLLEYLFPDIEQDYRSSVFMKRYIATVGKDKLKMKYRCSTCDKNNMFIFNIKTDNIELKQYDVKKTNISLLIRPSILKEIKPKDFLENIEEVIIDQIHYKWIDLSDQEKEQVYQALDMVDINDIKEQTLLYYQYKNKCCNDREVKIYNFIDLYKILFTVDEIFEFYKTNRILTNKGYTNADLMDMLYVERTIALSLVYNEEKK